MYLLKQVEQVTILVLEGPARLCQDSEQGDHRAAEVLVFITAIVALAVISLQKQPGGAEGVRLRRAVRPMLPDAPGGSNEPGHWASESLARQIR